MTDPNITSTAEAAAEIQAPTTVGWADDESVDRCIETHLARSPDGEITVRCEGAAHHGGDQHQGHVEARLVRWRSGDG